MVDCVTRAEEVALWVPKTASSKGLIVRRVIAFALFVPIGSSFRLLSTAIVAKRKSLPLLVPLSEIYFPLLLIGLVHYRG